MQAEAHSSETQTRAGLRWQQLGVVLESTPEGQVVSLPIVRVASTLGQVSNGSSMLVLEVSCWQGSLTLWAWGQPIW